MAAVLDRQPQIAAKASFAGMYGGVRMGYGGGSHIDAEYNVKANVPARKRSSRHRGGKPPSRRWTRVG